MAPAVGKWSALYVDLTFPTVTVVPMQIFRNCDRFVFEFYIYSTREQVNGAWLPLSCVACIYFGNSRENNDYIEIENHKSIDRHTESATV
jgi:hypothetical protein